MVQQLLCWLQEISNAVREGHRIPALLEDVHARDAGNGGASRDWGKMEQRRKHAKATYAALRSGKYTDIPDGRGRTAVFAAASRGAARLLRELVEVHGASLDVVDVDGDTALNYAIDRGHEVRRCDVGGVAASRGADTVLSRSTGHGSVHDISVHQAAAAMRRVRAGLESWLADTAAAARVQLNAHIDGPTTTVGRDSALQKPC